MTLLVTLKGTDGLVLAADSRGTFGDPRGVTAQNDAQQKAHVLAPHVAVLTAGSGEVGAMVIDQARREVGLRSLDGATNILQLLRDTSRASYADWFPSVPAIQPIPLVQSGQVASRPDLAFILGGYDDDTPRIVSLISAFDFNPMLHDYGFAVQGVAQYALYLLNRLYEPGRTIEELTPLAIYTITETASQDGKVGGPVNVITVTSAPPPDGGCKIVPRERVQAIEQANAARSQALRASFYSERGQ